MKPFRGDGLVSVGVTATRQPARDALRSPQAPSIPFGEPQKPEGGGDPRLLHATGVES